MDLLDAFQQAAIATDRDRRIVFWNKAAEKLFGWTADAVLGLDVLKVARLEPEPAKRVLDPVAHGGAWAGEFLLRTTTGETLPAFATVASIRDEHDAPAGMLGLSFGLSGERSDPRATVTGLAGARGPEGAAASR